MRFEVNRELMLDAARCVARVAPSKSPIDELNNILIESNDDTGEVYLTATNHEISIQQKIFASVMESGSMLITPRLLVDMMSKLEGDYVTLSADRPDVLKIRGGRCTFQINCLSSKFYPKPTMPFPEESVHMTGICSLAKRTVFAVGKDDSKPILQCVNIKLKNNAVHAEAFDGMRMMLTKDSSGPNDAQEFLLPGHALQMLASISSDSDVFEVSDIGKTIVFVRGDMIFTIRKLAVGDYVDTASLVKRIKPEYSAIVECEKMKEALGLILVSASVGNMREPVNLVMSGKEITLSCNSDYTNAQAVVPAKVLTETPNTGFFYNVSALLKLFQVVNGKIKMEINEKGFIFLKTSSEVYLQSPVQAPIRKSEHLTTKSKRAKGAEDVKVKKETQDVA